MPNYGTQSVKYLPPGFQLALFNAETPTPPQASIAFSPGSTDRGQYAPIVFIVQFSAAPSASTIYFQGSFTDVAADYQTLKTSTTLQQDFYEDDGIFPFYRVVLNAWTGSGTLTVVVKRR